jgi:hypothetical protein
VYSHCYSVHKVKLSHYHNAGAKGERRYSSYSFLTLALYWSEWSASCPPVPIVQEAGWAPEPVWTQRLEEKSFASAGDWTLVTRSVVRHYTDWARIRVYFNYTFLHIFIYFRWAHQNCTIKTLLYMLTPSDVYFTMRWFCMLYTCIKVKQSRYTPWRRLGGEEV